MTNIICGPETMRMICVFNPPLTGREVHTKEGYYELDE
ncbi:MAG: ectoine synthase [Desulfobacterales bacterium]